MSLLLNHSDFDLNPSEWGLELALVTNLTFAWWNTSLAPSGATRSTPLDRTIACRVISNLITQVGADFIALGEMSEVDLEAIRFICQEFDFEIKSEITKSGRSQFDICYAYNKNKIAVVESKDIVDGVGSSILRIAKRIDIVTPGDDTIIHLLVSHWPSRLYCYKDHSDRHLYALRLRDQFTRLVEDYGPNPYVVMLGDYNDEPFDASLCDQLKASRDVDLVRKRKHLLYNPFWQYLAKRSEAHHGAGSYYYKDGKVTKWHTFDQLIFSQAFLTSKSWMYRHCHDLVHEIPELVELILNPKMRFDHLPVFGRVERISQNG